MAEDDFLQLQKGLSELFGYFRQLSPGQLQGLCQIVNPGQDSTLDFRLLEALLQRPLPEFCKLVEFAEQYFDGLQGVPQNRGPFEKDERAHFALFYRLYSFKKLLEAVQKFDLLLKIIELIPTEKSQYEQLCILDELRVNLNQLNEHEIRAVHTQMIEISKYEPGTESEQLPDLIRINGSFHFFASLQLMLMWSIQDILTIWLKFPSFNHLQLLLLTKLKELSTSDLWDIIGLVFPASQIMPIEEEIMPPSGEATQPQRTAPRPDAPRPRNPQGPTISISEQPPDRCIYKRNVKPAPTVAIEGHNNVNDGTLYLVPLLMRCDNMEEVSKLMSGNDPVKVMATKTLSFRKLKITQTSHQLNETLFSLRFELRKYHGSHYEVLDTCTTNPFAVCSHSTQLKTRPKALPIIMEVIPQTGDPMGGTKVAILGSNFEESPTARVKFDEIEIRPTFHGPKTLIVLTPKHLPGTVTVKICNEPNQWSSSVGIFTYGSEGGVTYDSSFDNSTETSGLNNNYSLPFDQNLFDEIDYNGFFAGQDLKLN